jgi:SAM-dependent methyltransferase
MWLKRVTRIARIKSSGRVLDVGAGIGTFLHLVECTGQWSVAGTETSDKGIRLAEEMYGLKLQRGQLEDLQLPERSFDLVTFWHVLEHLPDPMRTLREARRLLAPGGVLVLAVPNDSLTSRLPYAVARDAASWLLSRIRRDGAYFSTVRMMFGPPAPGKEIHLSHFSRHSLVTAVRRAGLREAELSVDDHYACPSEGTDRRVALYSRLNALVGVNVSPTIFLVARNA